MAVSKIVTLEPKSTLIEVGEKVLTLEAEVRFLQDQIKLQREFILQGMKKNHLKSLKMDGGSIFLVSSRITLKVKDIEKAIEWAEKNNCLKVDTAKATQILRRTLKSLPKFFEKNIIEFLTIKSSTNNGHGV